MKHPCSLKSENTANNLFANKIPVYYTTRSHTHSILTHSASPTHCPTPPIASLSPATTSNSYICRTSSPSHTPNPPIQPVAPPIPSVQSSPSHMLNLPMPKLSCQKAHNMCQQCTLVYGSNSFTVLVLDVQLVR